MSDEIFFGVDAERQIAEHLAERAERVLLVARERYTDGLDRLAAVLGERVVGRFITTVPQVPGEVADAAVARARELDVDWVVAHGGGTPIGVAKAIALELDVRLAAVPTTYAGSERTDIWGVTRQGAKTTGRDARVRPQVVAYQPDLVGLDGPRSIQSLFNALAHSVEAIYAVEATDDARAAAAESLAPLVEAIRGLIADADDPQAREAASRGAWKASEALNGASMALHHQLAHVLGGSFGMPHAPTHAVLLPHTLNFNRTPALLEAAQAAWGTTDPAALLYDLQREAGLPLSLKSLEFPAEGIADAVQGVLAKRYANPREYTAEQLRSLLEDLFVGRRPSRFSARRQLVGATGPHAGVEYTVRGAPLATARVVVLALHGRGSNADRFLADLERVAPFDEVAWVAPQAAESTWYPKGHLAPLAENQPFMDSALSVVDAVWAALLAEVPGERIVPVGFSQGACLLLSWLTRTTHRPRRALAFTGSHTPLPDSDFGAAAGATVHLSRAAEDPWIPADAFADTVRALEAAGAAVSAHQIPGADHRVHDPDRDALRQTLEALMTDLRYLNGFGNILQSEALPDALPSTQNTPKRSPYDLVTEQINGTGFTVHRALNHRVWLYRLRPQILPEAWEPRAHGRFVGDFAAGVPTPQVLRFRPPALPDAPTDFLAGLTTFAGAGDPSQRRGAAVHLYAANKGMERTAFTDIDGDLLLVPELGGLRVRTEMGVLDVDPGELLIVPRGIRFQVLLRQGTARGFVAELFDGHFQLPERGPIGANGMADERHFLAPVAAFEDREEDWTIVAKQGGQLWQQTAPRSPFDVVAWHGSYLPFKYDLDQFNSLGSVSFDHVDPSILTVLTSPLDTHGRNAIDVGVFKGRWDVAEGTFRPPYFHRNSAVEFNAVIRSPEPDTLPWKPGAFTYTPYLTPHGVSTRGYASALEAPEGPVRMSDDSLWVQFESTYPMRVMPWMLDHDARDPDYLESFRGYQPGPKVP